MAQRKFKIDGGFSTDDASELLADLTMGGTIDMAGSKVLNVGDPTVGTDVASKTYVDTLVSDTINGAPGALDTLNELAAALGDDASFSTTVTNSIATKAAITYVDGLKTASDTYADAAELAAIASAEAKDVARMVTSDAYADAAELAAIASAEAKDVARMVTSDAYADAAEVAAVATAATAAQVKVDALETSLTHFHSAVTDITDAADDTYTFSELTNARHYAVFLNRMILRANEYSISGTTVTLVSGTHDVGDELEVTGFSS